MRGPFILLTACGCAAVLSAQAPPPSGKAERVEITPARAEAEVGQTLKFAASALDAGGARLAMPPTAWVAAPFDSASVDEAGSATFYHPGEIRIGAIIDGKPGFATVLVKPIAPARIAIAAPPAPVSVSAVVALTAAVVTRDGTPIGDATVRWTSESPAVASVDQAGVVTGIAPGKATIRAQAGAASATRTLDVIRITVTDLAVEPRTTQARTGDVVRFTARVGSVQTGPSPAVRWSVTGSGASIEPDGGFVAERPASYVVTASIGDRSAVATVIVSPRHVARPLEVVGRTPHEEFQTMEQWIVGKHAYVTSIVAGRLWVYDISNPAAPLKVDSLTFDARVLNDISTTPDGKVAVVTREGASNRRNGIVFLDTSDPAHPKIVSEYSETVSGGVHSAYIDGHHVYLTDDATGSLRVIDFEDVKKPKEVGRWEVDNPMARAVKMPDGSTLSGGRYLHDVQVVGGLLYAGYWRDGLVILDVGNGIRGGSPSSPKLVSQLRFNYHELYGPGWLAGAHAVFRYKQYVFVGDEVFPATFDITSRDVFPVKGMVHVVDVSDVANPRKVATYEVPEGGAHNMWVADDIMYMGYYNAGARVVDVSGELRGDLYRQGREIARLWTGDPKGFRPNAPFCWGAQPHNGLIYFNDINSGVWITRLRR